MEDDIKTKQDRQAILKAFARATDQALTAHREGPQKAFADFVADRAIWFLNTLRGTEAGMADATPSTQSLISSWVTAFTPSKAGGATATSSPSNGGTAKTPKKARVNDAAPPHDNNKGAPTSVPSAKATAPTVPAALPPKPATWASVARAPAVPPPQGTQAQLDEGWQTVGPRKPAAKEPVDERIFLRLPPNHQWRNVSTEGLRVHLCREMKVPLLTIKRTTAVSSGFAIVPADGEARKKVIAMQEKLAGLGVTLDLSAKWHTYIVPRVPTYISSVGCSEPTEPLIKEEVRRTARQMPMTARPTQSTENGRNWRDWVISFQKPVRDGFRIFGSIPARKLESRPRANQCPRCWGFHDPRTCQRAERCGNCGAPQHPDPPPGQSRCGKYPQCVNCHGPHAADLNVCPARPNIVDGKLMRITSRQLKQVQKLGDQLYKAAQRP